MSAESPATGSNAQPVGNLRCFRCQQEGHTSRNCTQPDTRQCRRCGEKGHTANSCMAENAKVLQNQNRMQTNLVSFEDEDFTDDEEEIMETSPAETKRGPGRPKRPEPYVKIPAIKKKPRTQDEQIRAESDEEEEFNEEI